MTCLFTCTPLCKSQRQHMKMKVLKSKNNNNSKVSFSKLLLLCKYSPLPLGGTAAPSAPPISSAPCVTFHTYFNCQMPVWYKQTVWWHFHGFSSSVNTGGAVGRLCISDTAQFFRGWGHSHSASAMHYLYSLRKIKVSYQSS